MVTLLQHGRYTLVETRSQTKILTLDASVFAWIWVAEIGELLISSYTNHKTDHQLARGTYNLYDVTDEPALTDLRHLELSIGKGGWQGYLLPTGLPEGTHSRKRVIPTSEVIGATP